MKQQPLADVARDACGWLARPRRRGEGRSGGRPGLAAAVGSALDGQWADGRAASQRAGGDETIWARARAAGAEGGRRRDDGCEQKVKGVSESAS